MPNFDDIPILYKIKDITKRLIFGIPKVPHKDIPQDATSLDIFWTTLKIKNIELIAEKRSVTRLIAVCLGRAFGTGHEVWRSLQATWDSQEK